MSETTERIAWMVDMLPESEQEFLLKAIKRLTMTRDTEDEYTQSLDDHAPWTETAERVARMVDTLPDSEQLFALEIVKRSVLACDLDVGFAKDFGITL